MPLFSLFKKTLHKLRGEKPVTEIDNLDKKLVTSLEPWKFPRFWQFKLLPRLLSRPEKWLLRSALAAAGLALIILGIFFLNNPANFEPRPGGAFREGLIGRPRFINPLWAANDNERDLSRLIYSSLVQYDESGNLVGDLAADFKIENDGRVYLFHLKERVWHDGEPIQASDVVFTIQTIQNPAWKSYLWRSFKGIKAEAVDQRTVKFELEKPYAPFLHLLTVGIIPEHIWRQVEPQNLALAAWNLTPMGSGPWQYAALSKTQNGQLLNYTLARNENYHGQRPFISKITFFFYDNLESAQRALKEGKIDNLGFVFRGSKKEIPQKRAAVNELELASYAAVFFNGRRNEFLEERNIRKALSFSIDKDELLAKINCGKKLEGPIPENLLGFLPALPKDKPSQEMINPLIEASGFQKKENGLWQKKDKTLEITLTTLNDQLYAKIANLIKEFWDKAGFKTNINLLEIQDFKNAVKSRNYEALLWSQNLGRDSDLFPFWHSSQTSDPGLNLTAFRNRQADALLEEARNTLDAQKRSQFYLDFQKILADESPAIFLYQPSFLYAVANKISGAETTTILNSPSDRFAGLANWYIKKRLKW